MLEMSASKLKDQISSLRENVLLSPTARDPIDRQKLRDRAIQHFEDSNESKEAREKRQSTFGTKIDWDNTKRLSSEERRKHELELAARRARQHEGSFHGLTAEQAREISRQQRFTPPHTKWDEEQERYKDVPRTLSPEERRKHELELAARRARQHEGSFHGLTAEQAKHFASSSHNKHIDWNKERERYKDVPRTLSPEERRKHELELAAHRARRHEGSFHGLTAEQAKGKGYAKTSGKIDWREERKKFKNSLQKISADEQRRHSLELASRRALRKEGKFHGLGVGFVSLSLSLSILSLT